MLLVTYWKFLGMILEHSGYFCVLCAIRLLTVSLLLLYRLQSGCCFISPCVNQCVIPLSDHVSK